MKLTAIQESIARAGLDGWLLYDFQGTNRISSRVAGIPSPLSRRWFCLVPAKGDPTWVVHRIEQGPFEHAPGRKIVYLSYRELGEALQRILGGVRRVAMEYSPRAMLPTTSRVDGGTIELVRGTGVEVVGSAELAQQFFAPWGSEGLASHRRAAAALDRAKEVALARVRESFATGRALTETEVQAGIVKDLTDAGLYFDHPPIVAVGSHAGNPHFEPSTEHDATIGRDSVLMIDLWAKERTEQAVYADMTWMAYTGTAMPEAVAGAWRAVREARDAVVEDLRCRFARGEQVTGGSLDRVARSVIEAAGHGAAFIHRTGHSIGRELHGDGANLDDLETRDDRVLLVDTGFSVEPGIYLPTFGIRSEIDVYLGPDGPEVTTPCQRDMTHIHT